jgi:uncharacterized membrane protein YgcG
LSTLRARLAALLGFCAIALAAASAHAEAIRSFDTSVRLSDSYDFEVEERIRWDFEGARKHGIFRLVPIHYQRPYADYRIRVDVLSVTDENGVPYTHRERTQGGNLEVRIGDANLLVSGEREYVIRYRVGRALLYFDDHDELYWNATGNDWPVTIDAATAAVTLPGNTVASIARHACFAGPAGSSLADCTQAEDGNTLQFTAKRALPPGSGLTVVVGLPKGFLPVKSSLRLFLERASDFLSPWLLLPIGALAFMGRQWRRQGRDPSGGDAIPVRYEPPAGLTPAEVGTLVDETADTRDVTATILDLAVRGFLTIEELESTRFLFLSNRDYRLRRTNALETPLKSHEKLLLSGVFRSKESVLLSELKDTFYTSLPGIQRALYAELSGDAAYFPTSPDRVRNNYRVAGVAIALLGGVAIFAEQSLQAIASPVVAGLIVVAFSGAMPRRTEKGRRACDEVLGFREFVTRVDQDRLARSGGRTADRFEKVLPYAVVLGVADQWATAFDGIYKEPPSWYQSSRYDRGFRTLDFVSDVGQSMNAMGSTFTSRPSSSGSGSSGSGSSGFSGGSSGGGFGGGGGGSW